MRVAIAGGITGGHLFPALAVAQALQARGHAVLYLGARHGIEGRTPLSIPHALLEMSGLRSTRRTPWSVALTLWRARREAHQHLRAFGAEVMFTTGGYASVPIAMGFLRLSRRLVLLEPDALPGGASAAEANFTLTTTGGITVTITGVSGSGAVYTVNTAVGGGTAGTATVRLDLKSNTDIAGTGLSIVGTVPAYTTGPAYTVNLVAPTVQAIQLLGTSPITNPTSLSFPFLVIFSEPVTNVTADDFALTTTGGITATVSSVSGSGAVYTVNTTVDGGTLPPTSTLRLDLKPNTDIVGSVSNVSGTPPYTTGPAYAITSIRVYLPIIVRP
jgi:hypothetical protein